MLSRRMFFASLAAASCARLAAAAPVARSPFGAVVVGAGLAGLAAAEQLLASGIERVVVLEKEGLLGGSSILANGLWQPEDGESPEYDGLAPFIDPGSPPRLRCAEALFALRDSVQEKGGVIRTGAQAKEIVTAGGRAAGVLFDSAGREEAALAERGVLLACGGYAHRSPLFAPGKIWRELPVLSAQGNRGDAIGIARGTGAAFLWPEKPLIDFPFTVPPRNWRDRCFYGRFGALLANGAGEALRPGDAAAPGSGLPAKRFLVFDEAVHVRSREQSPEDDERGRVRQGADPAFYFEARTLRELAQKAQIGWPALQAAAQEHFRRPLRPPFYAVPVTGALSLTLGGLRTDGQGRVLSRDGVPVPGLFAAGECAANFARRPGTALAEAWRTARAAARSAAGGAP